MDKKRLDVYIREDIREYIAIKARDEGKHLYTVTEELLLEAMAHRRSEVIEEQSLPAIRQIIQTEMIKANSQLRTAWQEDMYHTVITEIKTQARRTDDRIASLLIRSLRDSGIIRRLVYALLAKALGADTAQKIYEDAKEKAGQELSARSTPAEGKHE